MSSLGNKDIMAKNIKYYMELNKITQTDLCNTLGFKMSTFSDWIHAKTYPRIDKIEMLANYFGIEKSDLVENRSVQTEPKQPEDIQKLLTHYNNLNQIGKQEAEKRIEELTYIEKYKKDTGYREQLNAAHAIPGATEEEKKHDNDIMDDENF